MLHRWCELLQNNKQIHHRNYRISFKHNVQTSVTIHRTAGPPVLYNCSIHIRLGICAKFQRKSTDTSSGFRQL